MAMQLSDALGPDTIGWIGKVNGVTECVAAPQVMYSPSARREMRELVKRNGSDCNSCRLCPIAEMED